MSLRGEGPWAAPVSMRGWQPGYRKPKKCASSRPDCPSGPGGGTPSKKGSKGPIEADFAFVRVTRARRGRPGLAGWLMLRRSLEGAKEVKYFLSNAPAACPPAVLVRGSGLRWPVETALEEAKGELGMDHYETRTWRGWHHHMTQTFLAHHFLVRLRAVKKKPRH